MSLFPVERFKKLGFGGLAGVFVDRTNGVILKAAVGEEEFELLRSRVRYSPQVEERIDWFEQQPNLSEEELTASWVEFSTSYKFEIPDSKLERPDSKAQWSMRVAAAKSVLRSYGWLFNYVEEPPHVEEVDLP